MNKGTNQTIRCCTALILFSLALCQACKQETKTEEAPDGYCIPEGLKAKISIDTATMMPVTESRRLTGEVTYNPDKVVHYISLVSGIVMNTHFSLGDYVTSGQVLAELKSSDLSALLSERKTLESRLSVAVRNTQAAQAMYEDGISSEKSLLEARSEEQVIRAELEKTRTSLSFFSPGPQPETFLIRSPASGYIVDKNISSGMQIAAGGEPLFTISDLSNVWVNANVYTGDLSFVRENMEVSMRSTAYRDEAFSGTIRELSQVFDEAEKVLKARIVMDNPGLKLKPGMFIDVLATRQTGEKAIQVPEKAIVFNDNKSFVLVYKSDCDTEIREVSITGKCNGHVFISGGLHAGERIITRNHLLIFEALEGIRK